MKQSRHEKAIRERLTEIENQIIGAKARVQPLEASIAALVAERDGLNGVLVQVEKSEEVET